MPDAQPQPEQPSRRESPEEPALEIKDGDTAARRFGDETIILSLPASQYFSTNATGSLLWEKLSAGSTRSELVEALLAGFEVERDRAETDVDSFLSDCRRRGLLAGS